MEVLQTNGIDGTEVTPSSPSKPRNLRLGSVTTNSEQRRLTNWRLKVLQAAAGAGNVARTCPDIGISRKTFYKWRQRYQEHGDAGLADRARVPYHSPRATPAEVVSKILYLRQHYHFGPGKIADYLKRFHGVSIACASVHRILSRHGMNRLPANQKYRRHAHRWTRDEKAQPGHRLQVDVKFLERIAGTRRRFYQFTAIDDCTRIRVLKVFDACKQRTAIAFIDEVRRRFPFASMSFRPTMAQNSNPTSTGIWTRSRSATC